MSAVAAAAPSQALVFADKEQLKQELQLADPAAVHADPVADPELAKQADDVAARILKLDMNDQAGQEQSKAAVESMGMDLQREAARRSAMLKQPISQMMKAGDEGGTVATTLVGSPGTELEFAL